MEKLANGVYKLTLGVPETMTPVSILKPRARLEALNRLPDHPCPFNPAQLGLRLGAGGCTVEIPLDGEEDIYGLGLTLKSFRQSGLKKQLRTNCDPVADHGDSHAPVPFYVSTRGYGVLVDTARYATFYAGNVKVCGSRQDRENFPSAGTPKGHWWAKQGSGNMFVTIPAARGVDLYLFAGTDMRDAVARYNLFSGGGAYVPLWGLGVMYRGDMRGDAAHMLRLARGLRETGIPCDIFGLEPGWQSHAYSCTYVWDPRRYPDPQAFMEQMQSLGFRLNLWEHAYVHPDSPIFDAMKPFAGDCYVWDGLVPDFTLPQARQVFQGAHQAMVDGGVTGFKLDECDNSDMMANWGFPDFASFPGGLDGERMHTVLGLLYQRTMLELFQQRNLRTFGEVRQTSALAAPYPFVLYSDLYDHADFVRGMANAAFSGILWTPEVRQAASREELLRRIAAAVVSPQTVINSYMVAMPPWMQFNEEKNIAGQRLPDWEELTATVRTLLNMRMRLLPHLYAAYARYYLEGIPPVRPLAMDYPEDLNVRDIWDQYMLGEGLMAAPVIADTGDARRVYLPQGNWYDLYTGQRHAGGQWIEKSVPLDEIALFVREGTLLALAEPLPHVGRDTVFRLHAAAYGPGEVSAQLPDDDGVSNDYLTQGIPLCQLRAAGDACQLSPSRRYQVASFRRVM